MYSITEVEQDALFEHYSQDIELAHATLQFGIHYLEMELNWRKELIGRIAKRQERENTTGE